MPITASTVAASPSATRHQYHRRSGGSSAIARKKEWMLGPPSGIRKSRRTQRVFLTERTRKKLDPQVTQTSQKVATSRSVRGETCAHDVRTCVALGYRLCDGGSKRARAVWHPPASSPPAARGCARAIVVAICLLGSRTWRSLGTWRRQYCC